MNIKIVVLTAKGRFEHEINKPYIAIGRSKDNDIIIDDLSVSRKHAILEVDETGKLFLTDLNSSNGTFVNNVRIREKTPITTNDQILLGKATLLIETSEDFQGTVRIDASQLQEKLKGDETVREEIPVVPPVQQTPPPPPAPPVQPQVNQPVANNFEIPQTQPLPEREEVSYSEQHYQKPSEQPYRGNIVYGGIFERFVALVIDMLILIIPSSIILNVIRNMLSLMLTGGGLIVISIFFELIILVIIFVYLTIGYSKYGTTVGKKIMHLYLVDQKKLTKPTMKQAAIRTLVQMFVSGIFFVGYIMAFFNPEHKTLHDIIAKTYVIKK